ncbi:hypothetical protein TFLX_06466 [Thermoflexales bacterium]|nr:hypothetical protein TFLX_06466 [Thermoflexales bacterium]
MQFNRGANVVTSDGKGAGHVDRVVLDPKTKEITHLVIRRGLLQKEDRVVPINVVTSKYGGELTLELPSTEFEGLPVFEEEQLIPVNENQSGDPSSTALSPAYPGGAAGFANTGPQYRRETHLNIPDQTVALKEGARVVDHDNVEVGQVAQVLTGTPPVEVSHFLIAKGLLVKEHRLIPAEWVESLRDDEVQLTVTADAVEKLPIVEPAA